MNNIQHVMIIGSMKCGTSSLYFYLLNHPEICPCIIKEPEYFSENVRRSELRKKKYSELFKLKSHHKFTLEASTGYTKYPIEQNVPQKILDYGITPKFIYMLRDPFDRIESHYNYMARKRSSWKLRIDSEHLINTSNYYIQLKQYQKKFKKTDFLILDFEELKSNPKSLVNKVFSFLGASEIDTDVLPEIRNKTKSENKKGKKVKKYFKNKGIKSSTINSMIDLLYPSKKKTLSLKQRDKIHDCLEGDMMRLKNEYNIKVENWGFGN